MKMIMAQSGDLLGAIKLRSLFRRWSEDINYKNNGGKIYYAVDVNVIKMYADNENNYEYARIFQNDKEENLKVLAWTLSKYIFSRKNTMVSPMFLICPHNKELGRVKFGIMENAAKEKKKFDDNKEYIKAIFDEYNKDKSEEILIRELKEHTLDLIRFISGEEVGYHAQLSLIRRLEKSALIQPITKYKEKLSDGNEWIFPDLYEEISINHYEKMKEYKIKWIKELRRHTVKNIKPYGRYENNLHIDAEVMSRLQYINECIAQKDKRLVLITCDKKIKNAARCFEWNKYETFYDLFIRDPRVYFAAPDFFTHSHRENDKDSCELKLRNNEIIKWIEVSLCGISENNKINKIYESTDNSSVSYLDNVEKIRDIWEEYVNSNVVCSGFTEEEGKNKIKKLITTGDFDIIVEEINKKVGEVWYDFWKTSVEVGYWMVRDGEKRFGSENRIDNKTLLPLRGVPALRLTFPKAMSEIYKLCKLLAHSRVIEDDEIFKLLEKEDPTDYTAFLVYALAFGASGRWRISWMLSDIAISIANKNMNKGMINYNHEKITGNEAAYVAAWSVRHSSRNIKVLLRAKDYLREARDRKKEATGSSEDIRYDCEEVGVDISYNMYDIFMGGDGGQSKGVGTMYQCRERAKNIINIMSVSHKEDFSEQEYLFDLMVYRQSLTYYYLSDFIIRFKIGYIEDYDKSFSAKFVSKYGEIVNCEKYRTKSCINYVIYLLSVKLYGDGDNGVDEVDLELKKIYNNKKFKDCYVMPYDEMLFAFLMGIRNENTV